MGTLLRSQHLSNHVPREDMTSVADKLTEWWVPLLSASGLKPPRPGEIPDDVPCTKEGFAKRHPLDRKDALSRLANVGPMTRGDFAILGIETPEALASSDGTELYVKLQRLTGLSIDPCQHDVMLAVTHQARIGERKKWWAFTQTRKSMPPLRLPKMLGHAAVLADARTVAKSKSPSSAS